ncbi:hypothetical protein BOTBODRAFT_30718 [Botryobasidium botryosum FD-172 SS1]|uniref:Origin recognition complex subunit 5 C-terminal domain-containing protein n=1 Tax=Botryobasidium botryosum (strain FD-172 SS1) TaxID=930990 RepID=A0A067MZA8_BOTB1|nr:hypothetical protein BOTBODRAFT_30718 [Botryobasidium botryosum FD-172 SS1]
MLIHPSLARLSTLLAFQPPPFVFVHDPFDSLALYDFVGNISAGEADMQLAFAQVNAVECFNPRVLYTRIVNALAAWEPIWRTGGECWGGTERGQWDPSWDTFVETLRQLRQHLTLNEKGIANPSEPLAQLPSNEGPHFVVVFEKAERLKDLLPSLLIPLTRLSELAHIPITTIFHSAAPWSDVRPSFAAAPEPYHLPIPPLSQPETLHLLASLFPIRPDAPKISPYHSSLQPLYGFFIEAVYSVCGSNIKEPRELAYIAAARWPGFVSPLLEDWKAERDRVHGSDNEHEYEDDVGSHREKRRLAGEEVKGQRDGPDVAYPLPTEEGRMRLLRLFNQTFSSALTSLYPRTTHARAWARHNRATYRLSQPFDSHHNLLDISKAAVSPLSSLTRLAKVLLVASYVASFNPAKTDIRMFGRTPGGMRKRGWRHGPRKARKGKIAKASKPAARLTGPASFPLDRLIALYGLILMELDDIDVETSFAELELLKVHVFTTVTELVQMKLIHRASANSSASSHSGANSAAGGAGEKLEGSTLYKSNLDFDAGCRLAKEIGLDLTNLLWDSNN